LKELVKSRPTVDRFLHLLGAPSYPALVFFFAFDMLRFTGSGVIAEKPPVGHLPEFFRASVEKNCALDRK